MPAPAPDYETLYDFETAVETAVKNRLAEEAIDAFTQGETENLPAQRVDIQFRLGTETGHKGKRADGSFAADAWNYDLILSVGTACTDDPEATPPRLKSNHAKYRSRVRWLMQYFADKFGPDVLPYHVLTSIVHAGTSPGILSLDDCRISELTFRGLLSIRSGAWPE